MDHVISYITRRCLTKESPNGLEDPKYMNKSEYEEYLNNKDEAGIGLESEDAKSAYKQYLLNLTLEGKKNRRYNTEPYFDFTEGKWVIGEIQYMPVDFAYATTVHKSQGLTLDTVQIDINDGFFGQGSMSYVALSRCRTPQGLKIVGTPRILEERTNVFEEVLPWI